MKLVREYLYEKFKEESDPIADMGIGIYNLIDRWITNMEINSSCTINDNMEIDSKRGVYLRRISTFPDYIQFNSIGYDFVLKDSPNFTSLKGLPREVGGDFIFYNNGIKPTEEQIRSICDVKGYIMLVPRNEFMPKESRKKYKKLGLISKRLSPEINYKQRHLDQKYSRGYLLWRLLEYIKEEENYGGARYKDIVKFYYGREQRTLSSGLFYSLKRYIDRNKKKETKRYFLNNAGEQYLIKYNDAFKRN
jgi:hypothetical protein